MQISVYMGLNYTSSAPPKKKEPITLIVQTACYIHVQILGTLLKTEILATSTTQY